LEDIFGNLRLGLGPHASRTRPALGRGAMVECTHVHSLFVLGYVRPHLAAHTRSLPGRWPRERVVTHRHCCCCWTHPLKEELPVKVRLSARRWLATGSLLAARAIACVRGTLAAPCHCPSEDLTGCTIPLPARGVHWPPKEATGRSVSLPAGQATVREGCAAREAGARWLQDRCCSRALRWP
ncbi:hypothetical protein Dimus_031943, partial [Dionaea muscipula]